MSDDRTTYARLRDACIELVAEDGTRAATARAVAERAGVSLGLIRHHFGSMGQLLQACDQHIADVVRARKEEAITQAAGFDALAAVRATGSDHLMGYLAMRLGDDAPEINELVDTLVADAEGYIRAGVEAGMMTPSQDERARAAMLTLYALGSLRLFRHLERHFGLDVRSASLSEQPGFARYVRVQMELFASLLSPTILEQYSSVIDQLEDE